MEDGVAGATAIDGAKVSLPRMIAYAQPQQRIRYYSTM
jgi:hypothetical protein